MRTGQNGAYDGYGKLDYDNKEILRYYGNFEQGNFRPTFTQLVVSLCSKKSDGIVLTEQVKEYLTNNQFDISSPIRWRLNNEVPLETISNLVAEARIGAHITVDLSGANQLIKKAVLPSSLVQNVAIATASGRQDIGLTVICSEGSVTFNNATVMLIAEAAKKVATITLVVEKIEEDTLTTVQKEAVQAKAAASGAMVVAVVDSYILAGDSRIEDLGEGPLNLRLAANAYEGYEVAALNLWKIAEDGTMTKIEFEVNEEGDILFATENLGNFVILTE